MPVAAESFHPRDIIFSKVSQNLWIADVASNGQKLQGCVCPQVLERVVSFNAQQEAYQAFQKTEEEPRDVPLALTPIWELRFPRVKGKDAMVFKWNPQYHDLLAVGFGSLGRYGQAKKCLALCCIRLSLSH